MSDAKNCTPPEVLRRQIISHSEPKNEREWWACHRIEKLETALRMAMDDTPGWYDIARAALAEQEKKP